MFMTQEELFEMTDRKTPSTQIEWLKSRGYVYDIKASGKVLVSKDYVKMRLGLPIDCNVAKPTEPDFSSL